MTDPLTAISSIFVSLKAATDIAQLLRKTDLSLEKAELKLKLADLIDALANARIEMATVQGLLLEKDEKIKSLEKAADIKDKMKYEAPYYWFVEGNNKTGPYCQQCYDKDKKLIWLQDHSNGYWECKTCKNNYFDESHQVVKPRVIGGHDPYPNF